MSEKLPYYSFYVRDYLADTVHLSPMADLMYRRLLDHQWLHGAIPADPDVLARAIRFAPADVATYWPEVEEFFPGAEDGHLRNRRMEREREKIDQRSHAAASAAHMRWQKKRNADALRPQCQAEAEAEAEALPTTTAAREAFQREASEYLPDFDAVIRSSRAPDATVADIEAVVAKLRAEEHPTPWQAVGNALRYLRLQGHVVTRRPLEGLSRKTGRGPPRLDRAVGDGVVPIPKIRRL